ncbi:MAG TPA: Nif3-like dinuclear metal center hexameric protein [Gemmatimonadetes bacterium]|jgi:dinuclear metal center YbgI/SA1388 family protein|nr:Nif3-like dinuclear metal center hexameric protein [Gemmatimonadota bacterium]
MNLGAIVEYVNGYLGKEGFPDFEGAENGLQVNGAGLVDRLYAAVDASEEVIGRAGAKGPGLLLVHHGLFWGEKRSLTGPLFRKVEGLIKGGVGLYAAHLPLDAHPEVGNSAVLARECGLEPAGRFGRALGVEIGWWCETDLERSRLVETVEKVVGRESRLVAGGQKITRKVGVVTGSAGNMVRQAAENGVDTLITGEGSHPNYNEAMEFGVNVIYAGHYATETWGVRALGQHLGERFGLGMEFIDVPTGF